MTVSESVTVSSIERSQREGGREGEEGCVCVGGHSRGKENCIIFDPEPFTV